MHPELRKAYEDEMVAARHCYRAGRDAAAMAHLERAHVLGQRHVAPHVATHYWMLKIGLRRRAPRQAWGQLLRIVLGALGSAVGIVPAGNTGGTDIGMFRRLPLDPAVRRLLEK
ncbi:DUF3703 domain-containing protein [Massilia sp.]|uniref:DUF3703 domain-containing protein n=1 Tax=Massilia sp. TaxID=1882437 RepID=UPI00391A5AE6